MSSRNESEELDSGKNESEELDPGTLRPQSDRWHWRHKIRANPHRLRMYRVAVAITGGILVVFGFVTGPLPGPGGIPLILLGLAIWASEFAWAHRLMHWFKAQLAAFRRMRRAKQTILWLLFLGGCLFCGYGYLLLLGIPRWLPPAADGLLRRLPGL
jgi:uncharacterized protein (TIGR02611 family)